MPNPTQIGNLLTEVITVSTGLTYTLSGVLLTISKAAQLGTVISADVVSKGYKGWAVPGSETGQQFLFQAAQAGGTSAPLTELPAAATGLQGQLVRVLYLGN